MQKNKYGNKPRVIQFSHDMVYMAVKPEEYKKDSSQSILMTHVHGTMPGAMEPGEVLPPYVIGSDIERQIAEAIRPIVKQLVDNKMNTQVICSTFANAALLEMINNGAIRIPQDLPVIEIPSGRVRHSDHRS